MVIVTIIPIAIIKEVLTLINFLLAYSTIRYPFNYTYY